MTLTKAILTFVTGVSAVAPILFQSTPSGAQSFSVRDLECQTKAVSACVLKAYRDRCRSAAIRLGNCDTMGIPADRDRAIVENCTATVAANEFESCLVRVDIGAVLAEMQATTKAIREDQRSLLNGLCRAFSNQPDKCDDTLPPPKQ